MRVIEYSRVGGKYKFRLDVYGAYVLPPDLAREVRGWNVRTPFYTIKSGAISAQAGYAWDGASGPVFDTHRTLRATLIHDILYQAMRQRKINPADRKLADRTMLAILKEDRMWPHRRVWWYLAVRLFGWLAVRKER
ncbi:MAG: DUF1353 domain-containing protein [Bryobacterales bacterium]|nr:DUF1353 domain-containing protein [Bryobacterales bacterium]